MFMEKVIRIVESEQVGKNSTEGDEAAGLLENISVEDKKSVEKPRKMIKGKALVRKRRKNKKKNKDEHLVVGITNYLVTWH